MFAFLPAPPTAAAGIVETLIGGAVPRAARDIANQMDRQLMRRIGKLPDGRSYVMIVSTVAVELTDLSASSPLSRQISEEVMNALIAKGYRASELRKGKDIIMRSHSGEMLLTRDLSLLASRDVQSVAVLVGTYVLTPETVRFNMRLLHTPSNEVLAMGSATVPVSDEVKSLLSDRKKPEPPQPSVFTRLRD
jgi:hypothetical protein